MKVFAALVSLGVAIVVAVAAGRTVAHLLIGGTVEVLAGYSIILFISALAAVGITAILRQVQGPIE